MYLLDLLPPLPAPLAGVVVLMTMFATLSVARALARRRRRHDREEGRSLLRLMRGTLHDEPWTHRMTRAAARADAGTFWASIERLALSRDRAGLRRLATLFERNPHVLAERRRLYDDSPWRRELAARRIGLLPSKSTRHALRFALRRGPETVSMAAAHGLARAGDGAALRWLLAHPEILARRSRRALAGVLAAFRRRGLADIAAAFDRGIAHPTLELAAIDVLGQGGYRGARDGMEQRLADGTLDQRVASARALGLLQAVECSTSLLTAMRDEAWQVRAQAARALGRVRATIAIPALAARLTDPSWWVRRHAAYALGELGYDGQEALRRIVQTSPDPYARDMAREVLEGGVRLDVA
jgi:HEAT repeat protein